MQHKFKGGILIGIFVLSLMTWSVENNYPSQVMQFPKLHTPASRFINFSNFDAEKCIPAILAFLFIG
jgi:xanthine/uracil/vitamin C permease (AzgA family)